MYILISVYCNTELSVFRLTVWLHKRPYASVINFGLGFIFTGTHWFWAGRTHDFSQDESQDSP